MAGKVLLIGRPTPQMELVRSRLQEEFEVFWAEAVADALAKADQSGVCVAVLNIPDLPSEGLGLLRSLKRMSSSIEVITLNIPSALRFSIESMKSGAFADLTMPFDLDELVHKIRKAFQKAGSRQGGPSLRRRLEDLAVSVAFAEAGSFDNSLEITQNSNKPGPGPNSGQKQGGSKNGG
ncbi:MAG: hypothetical protein R6V10_13615 [bacterium]